MIRDGLDPVHHGHLDVHDDQVRGQGAGALQRADAVAGLADDLHAVLAGDQRGNGTAEQGLIVNQHDSYRWTGLAHRSPS